MVTHPSTNQAQCCLTSLIDPFTSHPLDHWLLDDAKVQNSDILNWNCYLTLKCKIQLFSLVISPACMHKCMKIWITIGQYLFNRHGKGKIKHIQFKYIKSSFIRHFELIFLCLASFENIFVKKSNTFTLLMSKNQRNHKQKTKTWNKKKQFQQTLFFWKEQKEFSTIKSSFIISL